MVDAGSGLDVWLWHGAMYGKGDGKYIGMVSSGADAELDLLTVEELMERGHLKSVRACVRHVEKAVEPDPGIMRMFIEWKLGKAGTRRVRDVSGVVGQVEVKVAEKGKGR